MKKHISLIATILVFLLMYSAASMHYPGFFSWGVFVDLLRDNVVMGVVAVGMTFVILSGGIDLSVGGMVGLTSILVGVLISKHHIHPAFAIGIAVGTGTVIGAFMGYLIAVFELPAFLVTLAGMFLTRGIAVIVSADTISIEHPWYDRIADMKLATPAAYLTIMAIGLYIAHLRPFGRAVYGIGGNETSAALMGLPVRNTKIKVYALCGMCAAFGGVLSTFVLSSGDPNSGHMLELDAIAAVVIGGTLLTGGVGGLIGTLFGVLILGVIQTAINFQGDLSSWWTKIVSGALILVFILLQKAIQNVRFLRQSS